ncbi:HEPN domain-containing protein [Olivibacter sitiensis]|uniref:HEPN domain-containing protein n=1 Tax=Olivibacter sitiensis TaxID=376470 RepID=UPI00048110A0|nr:HEPN domain-containing protein [Olivibacter sitiensis]
MQSFRTELENPVVEQDIIDLEKKIRAFREGQIHEERFRSLRLARGVYGQRQPGVQMVRIKLPFGKLSMKQFLRIADIADEYGSSNMHLTTRQDIQIHYVNLDRTPELWAKLEQDDITLREACGNTVRNVTASPTAGIDPLEPFDVSPYAHAVFSYFLRNPICQEMGRKIKIAFSSSEKDTAYSFIHDVGLIPKLDADGNRGFKVVVGGGLGAQPLLAYPVYEFLPANRIIPFMEAILRVFDRYGERNNRNKARMKFLIQKIGLEEFLALVKEEELANKVKHYEIVLDMLDEPALPEIYQGEGITLRDEEHYQKWLETNVFEQKQQGYYGVYVKIPIGDIKTDKGRAFIAAIKPYVADEIRITQSQSLLLKYVPENNIRPLYYALDKLGLTLVGYDSVADVTTCPGTDTCNLGISNSMTLAVVLEDLIYSEFPDLIYENNLKIKISGCMNSCGQHGLAEIGFHGSSLKVNGKVIPAVQVMLGGGIVGNGEGRVAERVIKTPSKRATDVLRVLLKDYEGNKSNNENFHAYYDRQGKDYFYRLLKPLADLTTLQPEEYVDWGHEETFSTAIGVGECAGVVVDLVATLLYESEEKLGWAQKSFDAGAWADSIYHSYSVYVGTAKALLLKKGINNSTQMAVIKDFDKYFVETSQFKLTSGSFENEVLQINKHEPSEAFAQEYLQAATSFLQRAKEAMEEVTV